MSEKKLMKIDGTSKSSHVTFYFDDRTTLSCRIGGNETNAFLSNSEGSNSEVFYQLGIQDPCQLYMKLNVFTGYGECPECSRKDLDTVFDYLLKNYSIKPVEKPIKEPTEWDWLLD